ncbi:hypothetical protein FKG94_18025 [Exilibacterium tricleocarpae]|uniref:DinB family protein n=1 Tax=Exilibacterium tricleocarpae TaxID=2591008 RepID=A0A545T5Z0_9GAMM|nr:hypothetical protein [Exilibacterium tricleocarpae]TQV72598.1 hypothetical protein FKG94_18025 [Exilibacterium tricleocarpae]
MKLPPDTDVLTDQLSDATLAVLQQLAALVGAVGDCYSREPEANASSIGCHVRHILDHFAALHGAAQTGRINYNTRSRGSDIEVDPASALARIAVLSSWVDNRGLQDRAIEIESEVSVSHYENVCMPGSLYREVIYVINHTIHHIAYARMIAGRMGITLDDYLGIAPATATYLRSTECTR